MNNKAITGKDSRYEEIFSVEKEVEHAGGTLIESSNYDSAPPRNNGWHAPIYDIRTH